jgi:hypothetical protein
MLVKRVVRGTLLAMVSGLFSAAPEVLAAGDEKCATPALLSPPSSGSRINPVAETVHRRQPGPQVPVSIGGIREAPPMGASGTGGTPSNLPVPPTTTQATPPSGGSPLPPPAVPGLTQPAAAKDKEDKSRRVAAIQAQGEVPEERLLDIGIEIFGPGVDEDDRTKLAKVGLSPEVRKSEGRFIAYHLRKTLEGTGNWGAVRVVPQTAAGLDVTVSGKILESNGKRLSLEVEAHDSLGERWLRKRYQEEADLAAYGTAEGTTKPEAFQEVYNRIANDLLRERDERKADELMVVRRVAVLRFAKELAPDVFGSYLKSNDDGRYKLVRLPAETDPMLARIASIRERDMMFVDTLNDYYLGFYDRMSGPYSDWKKYSYDEQDAMDRITKASRLKKILGGAAILAGMMMPRDAYGGNMAGDLAVMGGMIAMQSGFQQAGQKKMHETALKELAVSFDADTTPLLVEVEGQQRELAGSAEARFVAWRDLLHQIFSVESGAPDDPNRVVVFPPSPTI